MHSGEPYAACLEEGEGGIAGGKDMMKGGREEEKRVILTLNNYVKKANCCVIRRSIHWSSSSRQPGNYIYLFFLAHFQFRNSILKLM